ncbi:MAG: hypothetical protein R6W73_03865 [Candidatus Saliniplasma sp.]
MKEEKYRFGSIYFGIFGAAVLVLGIVEIVSGLLGIPVEIGPMIITGDFLLWKGLILFFAGGFYIYSVKNFKEIHQQAKMVMASMMIWVLAGMYLISTFLGSIPGGDGSWFKTWAGFTASYSGPYPPSLFVLPFSLVVLYYVRIHQLKGDLARENDKDTLKVDEDE